MTAAEQQLAQHAREIFDAALAAADPIRAIHRHVSIVDGALRVDDREYRLDRYKRVFVLGAGKAGASMAQAVETIFDDRITRGWVNVKDGYTLPLTRIHLHECSHPVPDERGLEGARAMADIASQAGEQDLVLCLISGGASALAPLPAPPVTLADKQETTKQLLACGANIHEINTVRKHLSAIKGGQLARLAGPATVITLILSDVIGDDLDVIGSGMTAPDRSTFADAIAVLDRFVIGERVPDAVQERLRAGRAGNVQDTPKPGDPLFERVTNVIVGSNRQALTAAAETATQLGYKPVILSSTIAGETRDVAAVHAAILREALDTGHPQSPPVCFISGGETTVTLRGQGKGGRNQEFVLAAAIELAGRSNVCILSGGTDGTDGPTDAAGAFATGSTITDAKEKGLDAQAFLRNNDSYNLFQPLEQLLMTGPTNTNVMDVRLLLAR